MWVLLGTVFGASLLGSLHCVGMCGGIVAAMGQAGAGRVEGGRAIATEAVPYHVGRIASYALMGAAVGALGAAFSWSVGTRMALRVAAGLLLIAAGAYVAGWWFGLGQLERWLSPVWRRISPLTRRLLPAETVGRRLALGALWGWLPCGLVYGALASAMSRGDAPSGALAMLAFGLGTLPALVATGTLARELPRLVRAPQTRKTAGILILLFGLWTLGTALLTLQRSHGHVH